MFHPNPLQAPPIFTATAVSILQDAERIVGICRKAYNHVVAAVPPGDANFGNAVLPLAQAENERMLGERGLIFYSNVSPDPQVRAASQQARSIFDAFDTETSLRQDVFALVDAVVANQENNPDPVVLDPESRHLLTKLHRDYVDRGMKLPAGPVRDRFKSIGERLRQLGNEFDESLTQPVDPYLWLTPQELEGVPDSVLAGLEEGEGEKAGMLRVSRRALWTTVSSARSSDARMRALVVLENARNTNEPIVKEAVVLRDEAARMLGYGNSAERSIGKRTMAKTPERVNAFLADLQARLGPAGRARMDQLRQAKREDVESRGGTFDGFFSWDETYYSRMVDRLKNNTAEAKPQGPSLAKVADYFTLQHTATAMLGIFARLLGLCFNELAKDDRDRLSPTGNGDDIIWHEDVRVFSAWDTSETGHGDSFLGYLYLDLYTRDGKDGHYCSNISPGFIREDGTRQYPVTALVCSFAGPTSDKPSLLGHFDVVQLFHELGHAIHDVVSKTRYARFHGPSGTPVDYGEMPSQMLENWCYQPAQLKAMSKHYSYLPGCEKAWETQNSNGSRPPETIPDDLIAAALGSGGPKHGALYYLRQIFLCIFDMAIHQPESHDAAIAMDLTDLWNSLHQSVCLFDDPAVLGLDKDLRSRGYTIFGHLMSDYNAGYYCYLFSNVYSADIFDSVFRADPMSAHQGRKYRLGVLEKGGSLEGAEILADFMGRGPSTEAFYKELGIC